MEAKGLISRERAASDARVTVVTLTPHGRALADAAYRNVRNHAAAIIDSVGIERLRAFFETARDICAVARPAPVSLDEEDGGRAPAAPARSRPNTPDGQNDSCGLYLYVNIS